MRSNAETLAKDYELGKTKEDYYQYIVDSLINGNRYQVRRLFNKMRKHYQKDFLINFIDVRNGFHKSVLNICIDELTD